MTHHNAYVRIFHMDNGTQYVIMAFDEYLSKYGKNRHLLEVTHCLIMEMNVAKFLWSEAVIMASYLINRISLRVLGYRTPLECFTGKISYVVPPKSLWMGMLCKRS
jgi:hypothetical protein